MCPLHTALPKIISPRDWFLVNKSPPRSQWAACLVRDPDLVACLLLRNPDRVARGYSVLAARVGLSPGITLQTAVSFPLL